jgi:transposase
MLRSKTMQTIRELATQGESIRAIAAATATARNTVRKYLRGTPTAAPRPKRGSKLAPFYDQIRQWVTEDHLYNCQTMFDRLQKQGYTGGRSLIKSFVQPLRPPRARQRPVRRYETRPGEQLQFDWGEFTYEVAGHTHKLYGFAGVLGYSRMRFACFTKRCDTPTLIRSLMAACEYFDGLPDAILTDRMKSVILTMDGRQPQWNPLFADFLAAIGVTPRVCRAYTPQTKGKIERSIGVVKTSFWAGVRFRDIADLNAQALAWCDRINQTVHATTHARPIDRWVEEGLRPLPQGFAWERYHLEERQVTRDGFISFDGVLYGVPAHAAVTGRTVQVGVRHHTLTIWAGGQVIASHPVQARSGSQVIHPAQFTDVLPAHQRVPAHQPLGHQVTAPSPARRDLHEYDALCGLGGAEVAA